MPARSVSRDIKKEVDTFFKRIYNVATIHPALSVDELLEMLKTYKTSSVQREREIFCCVLRTLFEECGFVHAYQENYLNIVANLLGGSIEYDLLSDYKELGYALRIILDSLKNRPESKMYNFGITALDRFKKRLKYFERYCAEISTIPHFQKFPQHLIEYLKKGKHSQGPTAASSLVPHADEERKNNLPQYPFTPNTHNVLAKENIATATTTNIILPTSTEVAEQKNVIEPPKNIQNKIKLIFDDMRQFNVQAKCKEVQRIIKRDHMPWLSEYIVTKRVGVERNLHGLYSNFLKYWNSEYLNSLILSETYKNIRVLLKNNEKVTDDFYQNPHLSLINNYGQWLGMMTLVKNIPIADDLDLKLLLVEAFNKGQQKLLFTVPFIASVLKSCSTSKEYGPKNPWTISILNCLAELHKEPDLKLWLKFEIEVLCKALRIEINKLKPMCVLKNPEMVKKLKRHLLS